MYSIIGMNEVMIDGYLDYEEFCLYYGEDKKEAAKALNLSRSYDDVRVITPQKEYITFQLMMTDRGNYLRQPWVTDQNEEIIPF